MLPSGIINNKKCAIGNGVVLDPWALINEINNLKNEGINIDNNNLYIADNICLILPIHKLLDEVNEKIRGENIPGVKNIIAISSAKGGVGKSNVTSNIAVSLANLG